MTKKIMLLILMVLLAVPLVPAAAQDHITYQSQPEELAIFLNNFAYARDLLTLAQGMEVQVSLPTVAYPETLVLRENGERIENYRINHSTGTPILTWESNTEADLREISLEYLMTGISWRPNYDMFIQSETEVALDFFAEIQNTTLELENVAVRLVAGRVDTSQPLGSTSTVTFNQYAAGYAQDAAGQSTGLTTPTGAVTIQHIYTPAPISAVPGDMLYTRLASADLTARRVLLWNASTDLQAQVIYKVLNSTEIPFAEGTVRSYENNLFIGGDFIEVTPVGSEGSVTVGSLQNIRVNRAESETSFEDTTEYDTDTRHDVTLTLSNFADEAVTVEVIDIWDAYAENDSFEFSLEPAREPGNLLRWEVEIPAGETVTIRYNYVTE